MRKIAFFVMILVAFGTNSYAATARQGRTGGASNASQSSGNTAVAARAATNARSGVRTGAPAAAPAITAARAATVTRGGTAGAPKPGVAARAATTQKVINNGTKISTAQQNVVVSEECRQKYEGCMDSFCMLDNTTGGRCLCSDRNAEFNDILAQIEKLDQQSYQMATVGVEKIEMGSNAEQAIANANAAAQSVIKQEQIEVKTSKRKSLDLSAWNTMVDFDDDVFSDDAVSSTPNLVDGKEGDELHRAAAQLCSAQIPECGKDLSMLQMMYSQKVRSDCSAYENSLKQQKNASAQKLAAAEQALREAALEQLQKANKYDLGQCTVEFKKCMQTTGGCGDDFSNCASVSAMDNTNTTKSSSKGSKMYAIKGSATTIEIFASTYDVLEGKKPLCMSVTESCVAVKDQVWNTFLREVAPQLKSAELIAEDKTRQDCIGNISQCFQKACKDNIDPNNPDGSYDMCLSRPEAMLNVCKIPLNACGVDASNKTTAANSQIWQYVVARLASMRVDSCTKEVKECLTAEDRCGKDYTQCVGLDTDAIIRMCPYEKLTGCVETYGSQVTSDQVYTQLSDMVQGIMLNIDNNMLTLCQQAADEAMIKVCGDNTDCNGLAIEDNIGARSLEYKICQYQPGSSTNYNHDACYMSPDGITDGILRDNIPLAGVVSGMIFWDEVDFDDNGNLIDMTEYLSKTGIKLDETQQTRMKSELGGLQNNINTAIKTIEADATVQFCMTGREVQGMKVKNGTRKNVGARATRTVDEEGNTVIANADSARFPELTKQMRQTIANAALQVAKENYYKKYNSLNKKMTDDFKAISERIVKMSEDDSMDARREAGRGACVRLAYADNTPYMTPTSIAAANMSANAGGIIEDTYVLPFTGADTGLKSSEAKMSVAERQMSATNQLKDNLTLKRTITTTYDWDTRVCKKCTTSQTCAKVRKPFLRSKYCSDWNPETVTCTDIQF